MIPAFKYRFAVFIIKIIASTWRINVIGNVPKSPSVIVFWHGLMLPVWKFFAQYKPNAVVSQSKDGSILTLLLEKWGYNVLRGSSSKGSKDVLADMEKVATDGFLLVTPDGPQGPIYQFKAGAAVVAQRTGVPLCMCGVNIYLPKIFWKSWDRFSLPVPFSKIVLCFPDPITISKKANRKTVSTIIDYTEEQLKILSDVE